MAADWGASDVVLWEPPEHGASGTLLQWFAALLVLVAGLAFGAGCVLGCWLGALCGRKALSRQEPEVRPAVARPSLARRPRRRAASPTVTVEAAGWQVSVPGGLDSGHG